MKRRGLILENRMSTNQFPVRKVYSLKGMKVVDFSIGDLSIVKMSRTVPTGDDRDTRRLDWLAGEILLGRRRIRDKARRLARTIDELVENEERLVSAIQTLGLNDDDRLILLTAFTEETIGDAEKVLSKIQGIRDARRSIDGALAKAKSIVGK